MEDTEQGPADGLPGPPAVEVVVGEDDDGFSFPVPPVVADACIVPVYPIFGRPPSPPLLGPAVAEVEVEGEDEPETATLRVPLGRLLLEEREFRARQKVGRSAVQRGDDESSAGGDEELEGVPPESYCLWAPGGQYSSAPASPRRCRKSGSTGSVLRWRRISDRLVGRSHSDGKEKFVFLAAPPGPGGPLAEPPTRSRRSDKEEEEEGGGGAGHRLRYYGRGGGGRRRSYLPYRQELVGLFANVSGLRRSYHPF